MSRYRDPRDAAKIDTYSRYLKRFYNFCREYDRPPTEKTLDFFMPNLPTDVRILIILYTFHFGLDEQMKRINRQYLKYLKNNFLEEKVKQELIRLESLNA